jgi:hypothetical protein
MPSLSPLDEVVGNQQSSHFRIGVLQSGPTRWRRVFEFESVVVPFFRKDCGMRN